MQSSSYHPLLAATVRTRCAVTPWTARQQVWQPDTAVPVGTLAVVDGCLTRTEDTWVSLTIPTLSAGCARYCLPHTWVVETEPTLETAYLALQVLVRKLRTHQPHPHRSHGCRRPGHAPTSAPTSPTLATAEPAPPPTEDERARVALWCRLRQAQLRYQVLWEQHFACELNAVFVLLCATADELTDRRHTHLEELVGELADSACECVGLPTFAGWWVVRHAHYHLARFLDAGIHGYDDPRIPRTLAALARQDTDTQAGVCLDAAEALPLPPDAV